MRLTVFILLIQAFSFSGHCEISQKIRQSLKPLQDISSLKANFVQTRHVKKWQTDVKTKGTFQFTRTPKKYVLWEIRDPSYMGVRMNEDGLAINSEKNNPSHWKPIKNKKMAEQMKNIFAWLSFDLVAMEKSFEIEALDQNKFLLTPKKSDSHFEKMSLLLNAKKLVQSIKLIESSGDSILIEFFNTQVKR